MQIYDLIYIIVYFMKASKTTIGLKPVFHD